MTTFYNLPIQILQNILDFGYNDGRNLLVTYKYMHVTTHTNKIIS